MGIHCVMIYLVFIIKIFSYECQEAMSFHNYLANILLHSKQCVPHLVLDTVRVPCCSLSKFCWKLKNEKIFCGKNDGTNILLTKYVDYSGSLFHELCRPDLEELSAYLHQLGASEVVTEEQLASYRIKEILKVGADCVTGRGAITCFPN